jgi:enoyl-CoA hydratase/carnithine racemase
MEIGHRIVRQIVGGTKHVIAAVEGYAAGAGLSLAACSDFVVASKSARFIASSSARLVSCRTCACYGRYQRASAPLRRSACLPRSARSRPVKPVKWASWTVWSSQARRSRPPSKQARSFSVAAPLPVALVKAAFASGIATLEDALRCEMDNQAALYLTRDHREAVAAFLEKRPPQFIGE